MTLVVAEPLLALASARSFERLGLGQKAIQMLSLAQRLEGLRAATGRLITPIRKRYGQLVPTLDLATVDATGLTGGAAATWDGGPATLVQDYLLTFASSGATYTLTPHAGATGAVAGPSRAWTGSLLLDGYLLTLIGPIVTGDAFAWSTSLVQDPGIALAVAEVAAHALLLNRGVDALTNKTLTEGYEHAMAWAASLGIPGEGELAADTAKTTKYGPLETGESSAYAWLDNP